MIFLFYIRKLLFFAIRCVLFVASCNGTNQQEKTYVTVVENQVVDHATITELLPESFYFLTASIESDISYDRDEIFYLMNLKENATRSREDILSGIERVSKKERFSIIQMRIDNAPTGIHLLIKIVGQYVIKQIKIDGIWHDIDTFKRLYQCQKFEPFDKKKHEQGIIAIQEYFHAIGYCHAVIHDEILYDHTQKYITIQLHIQPGKKFKIVDLTLFHDQFCPEDETLMREIFDMHCSSKLLHQEYTHEWLNKTFALFIEQLRLHGFLCTNLFCTEMLENSSSSVFLSITIKNSYHKRISFSGNKFFSLQELFEFVHTVFKNEHSITSDIIQEALLSLYTSYGFFHASIVSKKNNFETLYVIDEQNQSIISQICFSWVDIEDAQKIKYQHFLSQQLIGRPVSESTIKTTLDLCINELICDGFLGAKLVEHRYEKLKNDLVILHVTIDAGKQIYLDDIIVQVDQKIIGIPSNIFTLKKRTLVHLAMLSKQRDQILFLLHNAGYLHATVHPKLQKETERVILQWHVIPGTQFYFGKIIILGNPIISFQSVTKNIAFQTGELWQQNRIQQSLENLQKLSMYEYVEMYPALHRTDKTNDLFLRLIPDDPFEVRLRVGTELQYMQDYQSFGGITYKMGGSFIAKNRLRCADTIQFDADFAGNHREVVLSCNLPISLPTTIFSPIWNVWNVKTQGYHMRYTQPGVIGYPKNIYTVGRDGILCALCATRETSYINMSWGFELQKTVIKNKRYADIIAHLINFDDHLLGKEIPYLFLETNCLFDFLDDKIYPTRGASSLISLKYMLPCHGQSCYFAKLLYEQTFFVSALTCTLGVRFRLGYMFHKDFSKISPMERFYLGGSHSMRGYEADLFPPTSPLIEESGKVVYIPRGGKIMININTELRKKIVRYVTFALFHDIGALADNIEIVYAMVPLHTSGFGLRFDTPFGPLRFDIGWKWKLTHPDERRYAWYLSFGRSF